jgi:hypothetical protein
VVRQEPGRNLHFFATVGYRWKKLKEMKPAAAALVPAVKRTSILRASAYGGKFSQGGEAGRQTALPAVIIGAGSMILRNVM